MFGIHATPTASAAAHRPSPSDGAVVDLLSSDDDDDEPVVIDDSDDGVDMLAWDASADTDGDGVAPLPDMTDFDYSGFDIGALGSPQADVGSPVGSSFVAPVAPALLKAEAPVSLPTADFLMSFLPGMKPVDVAPAPAPELTETAADVKPEPGSDVKPDITSQDVKPEPAACVKAEDSAAPAAGSVKAEGPSVKDELVKPEVPPSATETVTISDDDDVDLDLASFIEKAVADVDDVASPAAAKLESSPKCEDPKAEPGLATGELVTSGKAAAGPSAPPPTPAAGGPSKGKGVDDDDDDVELVDLPTANKRQHGLAWASPILEDYEPGMVDCSTKMIVAMSILSLAAKNGEKTSVFSQSLGTLESLQASDF